ncbi:hypothetical protein GCM10027174_01710 [Salinifilum aidingensis]
MSRSDRALSGLLVLDAVLLGVLEVMYLPLYLGPVQFPITAAVAVVTTPLLVRLASRTSDHRAVSAAPLVAWFAAVFVLGMVGPGGDAVLLQDWRTLLLLGGGALSGALMLGVALGEQGARANARGGGGQRGVRFGPRP